MNNDLIGGSLFFGILATIITLLGFWMVRVCIILSRMIGIPEGIPSHLTSGVLLFVVWTACTYAILNKRDSDE